LQQRLQSCFFIIILEVAEGAVWRLYMDRGEFLSVLRESLEGFIPMEEVETNIDFYRNYFEESGQSDKKVIDELGDPRLIARTIIDAYKASKGPMADYYTEQARSEYSREHSEEYDDMSGSYYQYGRKVKWYEKLLFWAIIIIVIVLLFTLVGVFVGYVLPVILLVLLIKIIANHFKR